MSELMIEVHAYALSCGAASRFALCVRFISCNQLTRRMADHYDVIIIGTGAGGGTLLNKLAPSRGCVTVQAADPRHPARGGGDQ